ncbi:MAG: YeeE/YedE family protein [Casimicrobiaceae bacterium]
MQIDWALFTPASATVGGVLIGLSAAAFVLLLGRIAGISGIVGGLLRPRGGDMGWRIAFVAGTLVTPALYALLTALPEIRIDASYPLLAVAGLLVGFGTRLGSGCTSGHGVCGVSRGSGRSLAATVTFVLAGFVTVFVMRHVLAGGA